MVEEDLRSSELPSLDTEKAGKNYIWIFSLLGLVIVLFFLGGALFFGPRQSQKVAMALVPKAMRISFPKNALPMFGPRPTAAISPENEAMSILSKPAPTVKPRRKKAAPKEKTVRHRAAPRVVAPRSLYWIQVGSFSQLYEAQDVSSRLRKDGLAPSIQVASVKGKQFNRVRLGTYSSYKAAQSALAQLKKSSPTSFSSSYISKAQ